MSKRSEPYLEGPVTLKKIKYDHNNASLSIRKKTKSDFINILKLYAITPEGKKPKKFSNGIHPLLIGRENINTDLFLPIKKETVEIYSNNSGSHSDMALVLYNTESQFNDNILYSGSDSEKDVDSYMLLLMKEYPELNSIDDDVTEEFVENSIQSNANTENIQVIEKSVFFQENSRPGKLPLNDDNNNDDDNDMSISALIRKYTVEYDYANAIECALSDTDNENIHIENILAYYIQHGDNNSVKLCLAIASEKNNIYAMYESVYFYTYIQKNMCVAVNYCLKVISFTDKSKYIIDMCSILIDYYRGNSNVCEHTYMLMAIKYGDYQYIGRILYLYCTNTETEKFMNLYREYHSKIYICHKNELEKALQYFIDYYRKLKVKNIIFVSLFKLCYSFNSILIKQNFIYTLEHVYSKKSPIPRESMLDLFEYIDCNNFNTIVPSFRSLIISVQLHLNNIPKDDNYDNAKMALFKKLI
jgi:hypothetical protein